MRRKWEQLVRTQVEAAVDRYHPVLKAERMLDQVFRYQNLDALLARLRPVSPEVS